MNDLWQILSEGLNISNIALHDANTRIIGLESILGVALQEISNEEFSESSNKVQMLRKHFKCIFKGILPLYKEKNKDINFSESEETGMINFAIIQFLLFWIENAKNAKQKIYSFSKQNYALTEELKRHKEGDDTLDVDEAKRSEIDRGAKKIKNNILLSSEQAKFEGTNFHEPQFFKDNKYNFIELCFSELYSEYISTLYKLLYLNKHPLETTHHTNDEKGIITGYEEYQRFLQGVVDEKSDRLFAINGLLFFKLEYSFRWIFGAKIGKYMYDNNLDINSNLPQELIPFFSRIPNPGYINGINLSPFVKEYDDIINLAFKGVSDEKIANKIFLSRMIIEECLAIYCSLFKDNVYCELKDSDFKNIADFLKNEYHIEDVLLQLNLSNYEYQESPSVFDYIKAVFLNLGLYDTELLSWARDNIKNPKKLIMNGDNN